MTTVQTIIDDKMDALNVQTNVHIMLRLLRNGSNEHFIEPRIALMDNGRFEVYNHGAVRTTLASNSWHRALQQRFTFHPAIDKLLGNYRPHDWHLLVMEYPHQSETDRSRIAYTQSVRKGEADIQTVTSLGKYIRRHFPDVSDHVIRDAVAAYSVTGCKIVRTMAEMIYHLHRGPTSCMQKPSWDINEHPYQAYCPTLGWGMAVREAGGDTVGRALVNERTKSYVRTYLKRESFSHSDHDLEAWLQEQGYSKASDWENTHLKYIERRNNDFLAPYIDGDLKDVDETVGVDGQRVLVVREGGEWRCDQTCGNPSSNSGNECEDCGERCSEDDGYWVGRGEDRFVCDNCRDNGWTYAYSRGGRERYIESDQTAYVGGDYYDTDYLSDNNIVELDNGDYEHLDNAVYIESADAYYHVDDSDICYDDYNNRYEMRNECVELADGGMCHQDDAWQCEHTKEWYSDDVDFVDVCGEKFHPDAVAEIKETTEGE
jgi:hypothetical protein